MAEKHEKVNVPMAKTMGLIFPVLMLFFLVLYVKESGLTAQTYFEDYENAITVWNVGLDFFKTFMNSLDQVTFVLGKLFDFIVTSFDSILNYLINLVEAVNPDSWFDNFAEWARSVIWGLML